MSTSHTHFCSPSPSLLVCKYESICVTSEQVLTYCLSQVRAAKRSVSKASLLYASTKWQGSRQGSQRVTTTTPPSIRAVR